MAAINTFVFSGNDRVNIAERSGVYGPRTQDELRQRLVSEAVQQIRDNLAARRDASRINRTPIVTH